MTMPVQPPGPPAWGPPPFQAPPPQRSGLGVGALVVGILGLVFGIVPFLFWLGGILGVLALVLGVVGLGRARRGETNDKGQAVAGIALGSVAIVVSLAWLAVFLAAFAVDRADDGTHGRGTTASAAPAPAPESTREGVPEPTETGPVVLAFGKTHTYEDGVKVTVSKPLPYRPDQFAAGYEKGDTAVRMTVTIVNGSEKAIDVTTALPDASDAEGATAGAVFDGSRATEMFQGKVLPGKQAKSGFAFSLPADADGEMQVELAPQLLEYEPVIWTGPVKR
ncbi:MULTISPECIES: DUF4190 domain-containing protein [unclassified Streptomyces]|uniref:DUF4190 domain-containing protein n=1 Tax=unclassified Streptomyces TaxID=2593676 RepID=UPI0033BAF34E